MSKKIIITCTDRLAKTYEVDEHVAIQSGLFKDMIAAMRSGVLKDDYTITLPESICSKTFRKVIDYCQKLANEDEEETKGRDEIYHKLSFDARASQPHKLVPLMKAAEYLDIQPLVDAACRQLAYHLRGWSPLTIRSRFKIVGDNTPEAEARAKAWKY